MIVPRDFFAQPALTVAEALLGQQLVHQWTGHQLRGRIVETEAYIGPHDTACHAHKGRTKRTAVMFGPPGQLYIYLIYGLYHMLNVVTDRVDYPSAVLIRAVEPLAGQTVMSNHRGNPSDERQLTNGPGKLCQAFAIDRRLNDHDATCGQGLWFEQAEAIPTAQVSTGPRIGIAYASPEHQQAPWRFWITESRFVSPHR